MLYVAHIVTTVATLAIFSASAWRFARPKLLEMINIGRAGRGCAAALVGLATLGHQVGYNNILSMYAVVAADAAAVPAARAASASILDGVGVRPDLVRRRLLAGRAGNTIRPRGFWFLNPLSWQFLFVIGMAAMMHVRRGGTICCSAPAGRDLAGLISCSRLIWVRWSLWGLEAKLDLPAGACRLRQDLPVAAAPAACAGASLSHRGDPVAAQTSATCQQFERCAGHSGQALAAGVHRRHGAGDAMIGRSAEGGLWRRHACSTTGLIAAGLALQFALGLLAGMAADRSAGAASAPSSRSARCRDHAGMRSRLSCKPSP